MLAWLVKDWLDETGMEALFLLLDFLKVFDQVEHGFLWADMARLGVGDDFICLVQGLVCGATSLIFVNGTFSEEIELTQGVKHECPLSPMLFAIATQPLIAYFDFLLR